MGQIERAGLPEHLSRVHMVGIGGAGMSGLARILLARGGQVSGSDAKDSRGLLALRTRGAVVTIGHDPGALDSLPGGPSVVVTTHAAIPKSNPELVEAEKRGIDVILRPAVLATLMLGYRTLLVAGTHGKTSTTSMAVAALQHCGVDPSFAVGGELNESGTNAHHGSGDVFVAEADESDGSLLEYPASVVVVTNIEADHLDFFGSEAAYVEVFDKFVAGVQAGGVVVACLDDPGVRALLERSAETLRANDVQVWGYGHRDARERPEHLVAELLEFTAGPDGGSSRVRVHPPLVDEAVEMTLDTPIPGVHMALNALAATLAGSAVLAGGDGEVPALTDLAEGIAEFSGVRRRFEYRGSADGVRVYDDYAHHPTEVRAVLSAARLAAGDGRVIAVFQPHLYSRTAEFASEFAAALDLADEAIVADVYGAREDPMPGVSGRLITDQMSGRSRFVPVLSELVPAVVGAAEPGDVVLTLGAGDITMQGPEILAALGERA
ncbi:UDP-N-acetylmuramate--L-alanine ligase [Gordonia araii NBRC 100433]|uniref:UDP-N-acetylmuramate--L-alanine ligase n=1 Tax=Gordonia araii NBRC 100433 TaxID=1073574 RepID=G7H2T9_9ACTN|nr:UDP-N-acetylmuramate--L-alanine ligase [Gordonia araii]NNG98510.1 UDP-N-acetylmuramate--L-alanine ligase [Gordonia araii NBRC 100433]GAB10164.1 UDP-N-acetylmuramate--L-alanine ligase [Gordonia araii NBRC 100433]